MLLPAVPVTPMSSSRSRWLAVDPGGYLTQPGPRVGNDEHRQAGLNRSLAARWVGQHGNGPCGRGRSTKPGAVHPAAWQRGIQVTWLNGPGVVGNAGQPGPLAGRGSGLRFGWPQAEQLRQPG